MHNDSAEIAGIPTRLLREFSQRHEQIAEWLDATGRSGPAAAGQALLETRTSKQQLDDFATLEAGWRTRAEQLGWGPTQLDQLLAATPGPSPVDGGERWVIRETSWRAGEATPLMRTVSFEEWLDWLLTTRVTEKTGTFTRFDLAQAVAADTPRRHTDHRRRGDGESGARLPRHRPGRRPLDRAPRHRRARPDRRRRPRTALHVAIAARRRATAPRPAHRRRAGPDRSTRPGRRRRRDRGVDARRRPGHGDPRARPRPAIGSR